MEKEVMGKEEDGGAGRLLSRSLCCLAGGGSNSLISGFYLIHKHRIRWLHFTSRQVLMVSLLILETEVTRRFGTASVGDPSQRKRSASISHGDGRTSGGGTSTKFWSDGADGAVRLPDPPALCAIQLFLRLVQI